MNLFIGVEPAFYAELPAKFITVWDTYAPGGFWPSTKVSYGLVDWPSYSHWVVYDKDFD